MGNALNRYQGDTTITGGNLLRIAADGALGINPSSVITINTGTLDINPAASYTTTHPLVIGGTGGTIEVDGASNTVTINAALTGTPQAAPTGTLTKTGTGVLALGAVNNYGDTNVNTGTVQALNPRALGAGKVTLNGGQLALLDALPAQGTIALTSNSFNQDTIWGGSELVNLPVCRHHDRPRCSNGFRAVPGRGCIFSSGNRLAREWARDQQRQPYRQLPTATLLHAHGRYEQQYGPADRHQ